jgi:hypothetical protein
MSGDWKVAVTRECEPPDHSRKHQECARKVCFIPEFLRKANHDASGIRVGVADYIGAAAAIALMTSRTTAYWVGAQIPLVSRAAGRNLVHKLIASALWGGIHDKRADVTAGICLKIGLIPLGCGIIRLT